MISRFATLRAGYSGREILHGINFDVQRGETLVILGGSGSGKSTLLRTLVGLEKPTSGEVWIRGQNFSAISEAEIATKFASASGCLFRGRALRLHDRRRKCRFAPLRGTHQARAICTVEIHGSPEARPGGSSPALRIFFPRRLSGGMKKRAAVARALASWTRKSRFSTSLSMPPPPDHRPCRMIDQLILELKKPST